MYPIDGPQRDLQVIINTVKSAQTMLSHTRDDLDVMIKATVSELTARWQPSITVLGVNNTEGRPLGINLSAFRFPTFANYAVAQGLNCVLGLADVGSPASPVIVGAIIPTSDIPLTATLGPHPDLSLESVAMELTKMRLQYLGDGMDNN